MNLTINDVPEITISGIDFRNEFLTMYLCVQRMRRNKEPFSMSSVYNSRHVESNGSSVYGSGHSGATESYCARLVHIAINHGWNEFCKIFTVNKN